MSSEPEARAVTLVERLFALLRDCRAVVPQLEAARTEPELCLRLQRPIMRDYVTLTGPTDGATAAGGC